MLTFVGIPKANLTEVFVQHRSRFAKRSAGHEQSQAVRVATEGTITRPGTPTNKSEVSIKKNTSVMELFVVRHPWQSAFFNVLLYVI